MPLLEWEDESDFARFAEQTHQDLQPIGAVESRLVDRWIADTWRLDRLDKIESGLLMNAELT